MAQAPQAARRNVLVIDDSEGVRRIVVAHLTLRGFDARGAVDGAAGLEEVRLDPPHLVLCDLRMPRMDGLEFLDAVHATMPELPIVVMSGAGLVSDAVTALHRGASDYIEKPFAAMEVIDRAVERALERADLLAENRRYRESLEQVNCELRRTLCLLTDDEDAARKIQAQMLPRNRQQFGPYEFTREVVPAAYLSGDFIDAFALDTHRWGFYLADVAGHGVSSALVAVLLRTFVRRHAAEHTRAGGGEGHVLSPARLLDRLNEELCTNDLDKHVTIFYGVIDSRESTLLYANAGHFPWPILFDGERAVEIEQPGVPAGLLRSTRYGEHALTLPRNLVLAVFSDGLLEILPHADLIGKQAFLRALFGRPEVTVEQVRKDLRLDERSLPDDVAMLLIKRGGQ